MCQNTCMNYIGQILNFALKKIIESRRFWKILTTNNESTQKVLLNPQILFLWVKLLKRWVSFCTTQGLTGNILWDQKSVTQPLRCPHEGCGKVAANLQTNVTTWRYIAALGQSRRPRVISSWTLWSNTCPEWTRRVQQLLKFQSFRLFINQTDIIQ